MNVELDEVSSKGLGGLQALFGENRAEWPIEKFRELFVAPSYFQRLQSQRPTILIGGRGTGKTTSLRSLRFDATCSRIEALDSGNQQQRYFGLFVRINKNRVHAFSGSEVSAEIWAKAFAHYFNLLVSKEFVQLARWLETKTGSALSKRAISRIRLDLALEPDGAKESLDELSDDIKSSLSALQIYVNNPFSTRKPLFSLAEAPLRSFAEALADDGLIAKQTIFCCVDEYENLLDSQQSILNTYVKHAEPPLSYKIGVRKNGLRRLDTIDSEDLLQTPDDYELIDIASEGYEDFAKKVVTLRLGRARKLGLKLPNELSQFIPRLSFAEEAELLGAKEVANSVLRELSRDDELFSYFRKIPIHELYLLKYFSESDGTSVRELARDWTKSPEAWGNRINNYGFASLFWLSRGRKGARIRKYYSGVDTLISLSAGNIRYFLELIDAAISEEVARSSNDPTKTNFVLSHQAQTESAKTVGKRRLDQLEGLDTEGINLKRLVLAMGRVFFELARSPMGKTPEVTHFVVGGDTYQQEKIRKLLTVGVGHLAFEAAPRTKATSTTETKDDEYRLHRIFSAFFEYSYRRKRRVTFDATTLNKVFDKPSAAISGMLGNCASTVEEELPEQLALFSSFYTDDMK